MNKRLLISCLGVMMSMMSFAQWVQPTIANFFTSDTYAKELKVSEVGGDTTVYYLLNIEAPGFFSQGTCTAHSQWATHAALQTTGKKIILEKYIYTEIIQPEEGDEEAKPDTIVHPWDGKTYTLSDYGNYNSRGNMYYKFFPTDWFAMFVDHNGQANYMWEVLPQGNGVYYIKVSDYNPNYNDTAIGELLGYPNWISYLGFNAQDVDYVDRQVMALTPMLNPNLTSEDIEASDAFLNYMYGMDAKIKWAFIPEAEYNKYNDAIAAYNYAETFLANIEAIESEYSGIVNTDAARAVYENYNVSTYDDMKAAEKDLNQQIYDYKRAELAKASEDNPVDATALLVNPSFDTGNIDGWELTITTYTNRGYQYSAGTHDITLPDGTTVLGYDNGDCWISGFIEFWRSGNKPLGDGTIHQVITGLPAGKYTFSCDAIATHQGGQTPTGVYLFAKSGVYEFKEPISTGNNLPEHFERTFISVNDTITFGMKTESTNANWIAADNFKITYYGPVEDNPYKIALDAMIAQYEEKFAVMDDIKANAGVKEAYENALTEAMTASETGATDDDFLTATNTLMAAVDTLNLSIADYALVKTALDRCTSEQERFEGTAWEGLGAEYEDLKMTLDDGYNNGNAEELLTELELGEKSYSITIAELSDFMDQMIIDYITENVKPGDEITLLINNPSFDSNFSGWTRVSGNTPAWGGNKNSQGTNKAVNYETEENYVDMELTGGCAEVFHATFDIQQVVKNLPKGSYTLTVQAFSRHDDNKYQADWEAGPEVGVTAVIYCNEFQKKVQNILGSAQPWPIFGYGDNYSFDRENPDAYNKDGWAGDNYLAGYGFFPNGMEGANYHFNIDKANYENKIDFVLTEDGQDITIGIKNTATDSWVLFDNFRLYYNGSGKEVYIPLVNELKENLAAIIGTEEEPVSAGTDAKTSAQEAIDALDEVMSNDEKTPDDVLATIADANETLKYGKTSVELYSTLSNAVTDAYTAIENAYSYTYLPEETIAEIMGIADDAADVLESGSQTNEEVQETINTLNEKTAYINNSVTLHDNLAEAVANLEEALSTYSSTASASIVEVARAARSEANAALDSQNENDVVQALIDKANTYTGMLGAPDRSSLLPTDVASATAEAPVNVSGVIQNATFDTIGDFNGWLGSSFGAGGTTSTNAERYNMTFDTYQDISGLPAGYYVATVQGYYRHGSSANDWTLYNAEDNTTGTQAYFYATSGAEQKETMIQYASEWAMPADSTWRQGVEAGDGMYIPNTMAQAKIWFDRTTDTPINQFVENKAYYNHCIQIYVDETGYLRIGVKKDAKINDNDWSIFDNFQLYYVGSEEADLSTAIKTVDVADDAVKAEGIYNLQGQKLAAPVKGINIINGKKVLVK